MLWNPLHEFFNLERKFSRIHQKTAHSYCYTFLGLQAWIMQVEMLRVLLCGCGGVFVCLCCNLVRGLVRDLSSVTTQHGGRWRLQPGHVTVMSSWGLRLQLRSPHHGLCPLIFSAVQIKLDCVFLNSLGISDLMTVLWIPNLYSVTCRRRTSEIVR